MDVKGSFRPDTGMVDLGDGMQVPTEITATAKGVDGCDVEITAVYSPDAGRYAPRSVTVRSGEVDVTGDVLRTIPVAKILRGGVMSALQAVTLLSAGPAPADLGKAGPTDETLRWVARIYRLALLVGDAPTQAVAEGLSVPRSTAGRWVTRARDRGHLTVMDPRAARLE